MLPEQTKRGTKGFRPVSVVTRFHAAMTKAPNGCWEWNKPNKLGYGTISVGGKNQQAHRVSYLMFKGPIPAGLEIDHLCCNKRCVNPDHLEPVTHSVNIARANPRLWAGNAIKTHCRHGHLLPAKVNRRGRRPCPECNRIRMKTRRLKRRGLLAAMERK